MLEALHVETTIQVQIRCKGGLMDIALKEKMLLVRCDFNSINLPWMYDYIEHHINDILFLPRSILILNNENYNKEKVSFLDSLSEHYSFIHDFSKEFFYKSMLLYQKNPIKLEITKLPPKKTVTIKLKVYKDSNVQILLSRPNRWVLAYLRSQLNGFIAEQGKIYLLLSLKTTKAKEKLERTLNKKEILNVNIIYRYENDFIKKLYGSFSSFYSDTMQENETESINYNKYYNILGCPIGSSQNELKRNYKKLAKLYHPDRFFSTNKTAIEKHTQKFQLLQEAYSALKTVS